MKWQFLNAKKAHQAARRGWTIADIENVLDNPVETKTTLRLESGDPATVYFRVDGHYVARDDATGDIFHLSDLANSNWIDPFGDVVRSR